MKLQSILFIILIALVSSCDTDNKNNKVKHKTTDSAPWELLVVADKDWTKTADGEEFMKVMNTELSGLPQIEPIFKVININPAAFSKTFQGFDNIVFAEFGSKYSKAEIKQAQDVYAYPQTVLYITAPDGKSLAEYTTSNKERIIDILTKNEFKNINIELAKSHSSIVEKQAQKDFNLKINAPYDIDAIKTGKNFFWASSMNRNNRINLCMFTIPQETIQNEDELMDISDSVMKKYIIGEKDGQYYKSVRQSIITKNLKINDRIVTEVRGLWEMENDMMGGPFIMHFYNDSTNNRYVFAEGFVYAPEKKKRDYIRSLEASFYTIK